MCHGTRGAILLREEGVNGEDYIYDYFQMSFTELIFMPSTVLLAVLNECDP